MIMLPVKSRLTNGLRAIAISAATVIWLGASSQARAENLADALASAYNHSGLLEQNRALLRAADEDVAIAVAALRPIINWSADITRSFGRTSLSTGTVGIQQTEVNLGISASLLLYDFGRTEFQIDAAKETVLATRDALVSVEQQVLLRAVQAYMNVRRNSRFVSLRENNLRLIRQELRAAKDRFEVGEVTRTDVALAEARLAAARSGLAIAQGELVQSVEEFRAAMGRKPGNLQAPRRAPNLSGDVEAAKAVAVRKHPDMLKAQRDISAAELLMKAADAAKKPTVSLVGRLGAGEEVYGDDYSRTGSVGVQVTGPIYQGGALTATKRKAQAQRDGLRARLHVVRLQVMQNVGNAYAQLRATRASVIANQEQVRAARVAFRGVREEATLGARTTLDVLDAEQDLLDAEANLISAEADVMIASYAVLASMGELTAKDLRLNVQTYDPAAYYNLVKDAPIEGSKQGKQLDRVLKALGKE
jgi:outer membrane protein